MPFYTRIWELTPKEDDDAVTDTEDQSKYTVASQVYSMDAAAAQLATNNATAALDEESGQNYAEWSASNKLYKVWLEDNKLAGAAFWKLGFENSSVWDTVIKYLN